MGKLGARLSEVVVGATVVVLIELVGAMVVVAVVRVVLLAVVVLAVALAVVVGRTVVVLEDVEVEKSRSQR